MVALRTLAKRHQARWFGLDSGQASSFRNPPRRRRRRTRVGRAAGR